MIARVLLWNLADSQATLAELRDRLPWLDGDSRWIANEAQERFGLIAFGDELPESLAHVRELIGSDPEIAEEFDVVD